MTLRADNRLTDAPMTPIRCQRCSAKVLVRKSSWSQTSVQWDAAALTRCIERSNAKRLAAHEGHGLFLACTDLGASITDAVRRGELPVVDQFSAPTA